MNNYFKLFSKNLLLIIFFLLGTSVFAIANNKLSRCESSGKVQFDYVFWKGDKKDDFLSGMALKNTDLFIKGYLSDNILNYFVHFSFFNVTTQSNLSQAYITYISNKWSVKVGQMFSSFGLEQVTESNNRMFMERSLLGGINEKKYFGINCEFYSDYYILSTAIVIPEFEDNFDQIKNNRCSFLFRGIINPIKKIDTILHVGFNYKFITNYPEEISSSSVIAFKDIPVFNTINSLLNSHSSALSKFYVIGFEFAGVLNSLFVQFEYMMVSASWRDYEREFYSSWYIQGSYMLTGESHLYNSFTGSFLDPNPYSMFGAVEFVARYGYINLLNSGALLRGVSTCDGIKNYYTIGVNWVINKNFKVQINYSYEKIEYRISNTNIISGIGTRVQFLF